MNDPIEIFDYSEPYIKRAVEIAANGRFSIMFEGAPNSGKSTWIQLILMLQGNLEAAHKAVKPSDIYQLLAADAPLWITGEHLLLNGSSRLLVNNINPSTQILMEYVRCDCGWFGDPVKPCWCSVEAIEQHQRRLHPSFTQWFHLTVDLRGEPLRKQSGESFAQVQQRVNEFRLANPVIKRLELDYSAEQLLRISTKRMALSYRQEARLCEVANVIALMATDYDHIAVQHIAEAINWLKRT